MERSVTRAMNTPADAPIMLQTTSVVAGKREWLNSWDTSATSDRTAAKPTTVAAPRRSPLKKNPRGTYRRVLTTTSLMVHDSNGIHRTRVHSGCACRSVKGTDPRRSATHHTTRATR